MSDEYHIDGWHLDKRISIGHLVTTLVVIVSFVSWMIRLESQVESIQIQAESNIERVDERINHIEASMDGHYVEIIRRLEKLDDRLAEHMEKSQQRRDAQ